MINMAHQRGIAQGILLYPRFALYRALAEMLLCALHIEFGKPETDDQKADFLAGYATGQRIMEDAMTGPAPLPTPDDSPPTDPAVRIVADYVSRLEIMVADANRRTKEALERGDAWRDGYNQMARFAAELCEWTPLQRRDYDNLRRAVNERTTPKVAPEAEPAHACD